MPIRRNSGRRCCRLSPAQRVRIDRSPRPNVPYLCSVRLFHSFIIHSPAEPDARALNTAFAVQAENRVQFTKFATDSQCPVLFVQKFAGPEGTSRTTFEFSLEMKFLPGRIAAMSFVKRATVLETTKTLPMQLQVRPFRFHSSGHADQIVVRAW